MALTKYKLGELIELVDERNFDNLFGADSVVGLGTQKEIISTKADLDGVNLTSYKLFPPKSFAYVPDTSRRGDKISLAHNTEDKIFLVSSISVVFKVGREKILSPDYLFMYFNRLEFDRYARFHSWGSARESFSWAEMCEMEINLPPLFVQKKFVAVYNALLENKKVYEHGLDNLKLVCDGYIENLRRNMPREKIGNYIELSDERNADNFYTAEDVRGISIDKKFIPTKADMEGVSLKNYFLVKPEAFAFVPVTSRNGGKISIAQNDSGENFICSTAYVVFSTNAEKLLPQYLMLFFNRSEFDRYARFHSWGSAREVFTWKDMCEVEIPIPEIKIQRSIAAIYEVLRTRKKILERLKTQIKNICPILIKGSLDEGATT